MLALLLTKLGASARLVWPTGSSRFLLETQLRDQRSLPQLVELNQGGQLVLKKEHGRVDEKYARPEAGSRGPKGDERLVGRKKVSLCPQSRFTVGKQCLGAEKRETNFLSLSVS